MSVIVKMFNISSVG